MDSNFDLSRMSVAEFVTFFQKMGCVRQKNFVKEHQSDILAMQNADVFSFLCSKGFYIFLLPLIEIGDKEDSFEAFSTYYGRKHYVRLKLPKEDEIILMKKAAQRFDMVYQLRENTTFFEGGNGYYQYLRYIIYENASKECLNYLFGWVIKEGLTITRKEGLLLFAKADEAVLRKYITKISFFTGKCTGVNFPQIMELYERSDFSHETKMELICLAINHFNISGAIITKMRKVGILFK